MFTHFIELACHKNYRIRHKTNPNSELLRVPPSKTALVAAGRECISAKRTALLYKCGMGIKILRPREKSLKYLRW